MIRPTVTSEVTVSWKIAYGKNGLPVRVWKSCSRW